jgi:hypothetical protein
MTITSAFALVRVVVAFCFIFLCVPLIAERRRTPRRSLTAAKGLPDGMRTLQLFIHASIAVEVGCLLLGTLRLCLPGVLLTLCLLAALLPALSERAAAAKSDGGRFWLSLFLFLENPQAAKSQVAAQFAQRITFLRNKELWITVAVSSLLLAFTARYALTQFHFDHAETYVRAISLATLTEGQHWEADSSIALLAPLVPFSGLDAASAIRFSGPIFAVIFSLIVALCLSQVWHSYLALYASAAAFCLAAGLSPGILFEWNPVTAAGVYWVASAAVWSASKRDSLLAALTALMISPGQWPWAIVCLGLLCAMNSKARVSYRPFRYLAAAGASAMCLLPIGLFRPLNAESARITQYESSARLSNFIAQQFRHKEWVIVSPFQELAFTYGRGWHVELSEFVSPFTTAQLSNPNFRFPYDNPDVFFFIERRPLVVGSSSTAGGAAWRYAPAETADWATFLYTDPLGRSSLEYRAAELLNAYRRHHHNLTIFFEDDDITVYHLTRGSAA